MSAEGHYKPLPEAATARIKTSLKLPYQVEEVIGLNTTLSERFMQVGGIANMTLKNSNRTNTPNVVGVGRDGSALAGFSSEAEISHSSNLRDSTPMKSASWSNLTVAISEEMAVDRLKKDGHDVQNPANWAPVIDGSIKDGIISASFDNLIKRRPINFVINGVAIIWTKYMIEIKDYFNLMFATGMWHVYGRIADIKECGIEKPGKGKRWSVSTLEFPEIDRMAIQSLALPFAKLVKSIK